jgi:hypothetical protein
MDHIELPRQFLVNGGEPPPVHEWISQLEKMTDGEIEKHRELAIHCLSQNVVSQAWAPHIGAAERILSDRKKLA